MKSVGIRELKDRLSEYVRRARRGEIVAELRSPDTPRAGEPPGLRELVRQGTARRVVTNDPSLYPAFSMLDPGTRASLCSVGL